MTDKPIPKQIDAFELPSIGKSLRSSSHKDVRNGATVMVLTTLFVWLLASLPEIFGLIAYFLSWINIVIYARRTAATRVSGSYSKVTLSLFMATHSYILAVGLS